MEVGLNLKTMRKKSEFDVVESFNVILHGMMDSVTI